MHAPLDNVQGYPCNLIIIPLLLYQCQQSYPQPAYCDAILNRFKMTDCKPASTPAEKNLTLLPRNEDDEPPDFLYRQAV